VVSKVPITAIVIAFEMTHTDFNWYAADDWSVTAYLVAAASPLGRSMADFGVVNGITWKSSDSGLELTAKTMPRRNSSADDS